MWVAQGGLIRAQGLGLPNLEEHSQGTSAGRGNEGNVGHREGTGGTALDMANGQGLKPKLELRHAGCTAEGCTATVPAAHGI